MGAGFVYIMINPAMPGLVKIGLTESTSEARARRLSSDTGVPASFQVIYEELVAEPAQVERRMHQRFAEFRYNARREFFTLPPKTAIKALIEEAQGFGIRVDEASRAEVTAAVRERFGSLLRPLIRHVFVVQLDGMCLLEMVEAPQKPTSPDELVISQEDLKIMGGELTDPCCPGETFYFRPSDSAAVNAQKLIELDSYSLIMVTNLFTHEGALEIAAEFEPYEPDEPSSLWLGETWTD